MLYARKYRYIYVCTNKFIYKGSKLKMLCMLISLYEFENIKYFFYFFISLQNIHLYT